MTLLIPWALFQAIWEETHINVCCTSSFYYFQTMPTCGAGLRPYRSTARIAFVLATRPIVPEVTMLGSIDGRFTMPNFGFVFSLSCSPCWLSTKKYDDWKRPIASLSFEHPRGIYKHQKTKKTRRGNQVCFESQVAVMDSRDAKV